MVARRPAAGGSLSDRAPTHMGIAAFFDIDRTLITAGSGLLYVKYLLRRGWPVVAVGEVS